MNKHLPHKAVMAESIQFNLLAIIDKSKNEKPLNRRLPNFKQTLMMCWHLRTIGTFQPVEFFAKFLQIWMTNALNRA